MGAEIPQSRTPGGQNFVLWFLIFLGPQHGISSIGVLPRIVKLLLDLCKKFMYPLLVYKHFK